MSVAHLYVYISTHTNIPNHVARSRAALFLFILLLDFYFKYGYGYRRKTQQKLSIL